jgi:heme-degrading monooxygenase HmoA
MIAVIFELMPMVGREQDYFDRAAGLKETLETMDGFISVERYQSLANKGKFLSLSFWRDEAAVANWRQLMAHRQAQAAGRAGIFSDYRLRVAHVMRDYGLSAREEAPADARAYHR